MNSLDIRRARRLALARAGLLNPGWIGLPKAASGHGKRARRSALRLLEHFGYLQLDTVSVSGARSHSLVLMSRFDGMDARVGEELLNPASYEAGHSPIFEYWGHEASWIPLELYPAFDFRRRSLRSHRWVASCLDENPKLADEILQRTRETGAFRSTDLEGSGGGPWWGFKLSKRVATSLWSCGELAIRERRAFQRTFDLPERIVPPQQLKAQWTLEESLIRLLRKALEGHGWATTGTLASTWRLRNLRPELQSALRSMEDAGEIVPCRLERSRDSPINGWIRPADLELAERLQRVRPNRDSGVLLSPFDPVLWDRPRVKLLFDFDQVLEIFKPEPQRVYGYFCLPVLSGEELVARVDLKADHKKQTLETRSLHLEESVATRRATAATHTAVARHARGLNLKIV